MTTITTKYPFVGNVDTRIGGRDENQDNAGFVDTPLGLLLVVCDGMGGGPGGRAASQQAVDTILDLLVDVSPSTPRDQALKYAIEKANDTIYSNAKNILELRGMGTTVAAVIVNEQSAVIAHVGDSRIYLLRRGDIIYRSNDHSLVANLVREHKITEEEARNHPRSNVITMALGIRPDIEPEIDEISFQCGDRFILCTDGIWGAMPQHELIISLSRAMGISELTTNILEEIDALENAAGGGHDNMTLAVLDATFDSAVKKTNKTAIHDFQTDDIKQRSKRSFLLKVLLPILAVAMLSAFSVYFYNHFTSSSAEQDQHLDKESPDMIDQNVNLDDDRVANHQNDSIQSITRRVSKPMKNPLNDRNMHEVQQIVISKKIDLIANNLDSLKNITSSDRKQLQELKKNFVNRFILPDVHFVASNVDQRKKQELDIIKDLLNDNKTYGADKFGKSTEDSNKHIDKIKERIKKLQD